MRLSVRLFLLVAVVIVGATGANADSIQLNVVDGILMGARNLNIGGSFYDVDFREGTCAQLFNCGTNATFFFTLDQIIQADNLLMSQVFTDSALGLFNSHPEFIFGCGPVSQELYPTCYVVTPFASNAFQSSLEGVINHGMDGANDSAAISYIDNNASTADMPLGREMVFAMWRTHVVPEPSSLALLGFGIALTALWKKNR